MTETVIRKKWSVVFEVRQTMGGTKNGDGRNTHPISLKSLDKPTTTGETSVMNPPEKKPNRAAKTMIEVAVLAASMVKRTIPAPRVQRDWTRKGPAKSAMMFGIVLHTERGPEEEGEQKEDWGKPGHTRRGREEGENSPTEKAAGVEDG